MFKLMGKKIFTFLRSRNFVYLNLGGNNSELFAILNVAASKDGNGCKDGKQHWTALMGVVE